MKRFLAILLAFLMLFAVCACDKDDKKEDEDEGGSNTYTGSIWGKGDNTVLTIDGEVATIEATLVNKTPTSQQDYSVTLTAAFTKDGDKYVFDFTKEGTKTLASMSVTGEDAAKVVETMLGLSYNKDPLYVDFCNGKEVEITTESNVWKAIGFPESVVIKLNDDNTFSVVRE